MRFYSFTTKNTPCTYLYMRFHSFTTMNTPRTHLSVHKLGYQECLTRGPNTVVLSSSWFADGCKSSCPTKLSCWSNVDVICNCTLLVWDIVIFILHICTLMRSPVWYLLMLSTLGSVFVTPAQCSIINVPLCLWTFLLLHNICFRHRFLKYLVCADLLVTVHECIEMFRKECCEIAIDIQYANVTMKLLCIYQYQDFLHPGPNKLENCALQGSSQHPRQHACLSSSS